MTRTPFNQLLGGTTPGEGSVPAASDSPPGGAAGHNRYGVPNYPNSYQHH